MENEDFLTGRFTPAMTARLAELVRDNYNKINPGNGTPDARRMSNNAWNEIALALNAENPDNRKTVEQCKQKWANIKKNTKAKVAKQKKWFFK